MAMDDPDDLSPASAAPARPKTKRFWNWKLIGLELIVTVAGFGEFVAGGARFPRLVGLGIGFLGLWLLSREVLGLAISSQRISLPSGRHPGFPIFSRGRLTIKAGNLRELTVTNRWLTFEIASIQGGFGTEVLMFQSRGQRLRFMGALEKNCPHVKMFRKMAPPVDL